jgi:hypothetical protein
MSGYMVQGLGVGSPHRVSLKLLDGAVVCDLARRQLLAHDVRDDAPQAEHVRLAIVSFETWDCAKQHQDVCTLSCGTGY